ncbi:mannose-1-phosphate guanylyltransferase [Haliscomenobacter hydrossis]|uniref:mannose-1-phosphate guanylyltransferase n=1 Tax=Haliscomenobacter hydrossis (strain ATCC 27775 / DSM 1100 / LMG 10767 / O) TaxID=760192 RepID=F4KZX6_HALH1|nr:mannose-1-phosphate guanylyltransferase [Haliscomenobacter hydrossis]AEE51546.1 Mannose-1-phosphate guanylyltransferase [Haliscomenobacter hydrossis DSM 1100]
MPNNNNYVAIMAGGVGSRFWPASRTATPKQFLDILGIGKSLLRMTFERFLALCPAENIFVVTNGIYRELVKEHLPELSDNQILCEPSRNNTAPCVAYTALKLKALNAEANLVIAPSDHIILNEARFIEALNTALDFTNQHDALLTLGIQPTRPDTGYGYINYQKAPIEGEVHQVIRFTEKPPLEQAQAFLASGDYLWNAGIFIWKVEHLLAAFARHAKEILDVLDAEPEHYNTSTEQAYIDRVYPNTLSISIDYAIMEKADNVFTIPSSFGWSDLGTWASLHSEAEQDAQNNVINLGPHLLRGVNNCLLRAPKDKLVVITDLEDYIVVDEDDILLIHPKSKEQEIKKITEAIGNQFGASFL